MKTKLPTKPDKPSFTWNYLETDDERPTKRCVLGNKVCKPALVRVNWKPKMNGNSGSYFNVELRTEHLQCTIPIVDLDFDVFSLDRNTTYELSFVAADGQYETASDKQTIFTGKDFFYCARFYKLEFLITRYLLN